STSVNFKAMLYLWLKSIFPGVGFMSAPSRRPEIRRRRARKEKILQLRKRLAAPKNDADRQRITANLHKLAIASPRHALLKESFGFRLFRCLHRFFRRPS